MFGRVHVQPGLLFDVNKVIRYVLLLLPWPSSSLGFCRRGYFHSQVLVAAAAMVPHVLDMPVALGAQRDESFDSPGGIQQREDEGFHRTTVASERVGLQGVGL